MSRKRVLKRQRAVPPFRSDINVLLAFHARSPTAPRVQCDASTSPCSHRAIRLLFLTLRPLHLCVQTQLPTFGCAGQTQRRRARREGKVEVAAPCLCVLFSSELRLNYRRSVAQNKRRGEERAERAKSKSLHRASASS